MDNSIFIYTDKNDKLELERFHNCTWEFKDDSALVEFGFEVRSDSLQNKEAIKFNIYIPWLPESCEICDMYNNLISSTNSRFIFNESVESVEFLHVGNENLGVTHNFTDRSLSILPISIKNNGRQKLELEINISHYRDHYRGKDGPNIYFRFKVKPKSSISTRKKGISKSTIIYDFKVNERRNIPQNLLSDISNSTLCGIKNCFSFNILPNSYDLSFMDSTSLKNVRTLEYESFVKYLPDNRVKKDDLIVVFNKRSNLHSYSFFSIYTKERIGVPQLVVAILLNIVCGVLFYIAPSRQNFDLKFNEYSIITFFPLEINVAIGFAFIATLYIQYPNLVRIYKKALGI